MTVLDLARMPPIGVAEDQIPEALRALAPRCDREVLHELAARLRKEAESAAELSAARRRHAAPPMKAAVTSVPDIGAALQVSSQRAHQLLNS